MGALRSGAARLCFLGKPALIVEGRLQTFGAPRKAVALLAYLAAHRDRGVSRAAVAQLFWPDETDEDARAALRRHLHRALSALPEAPARHPWVIADKTTLRWNADAPIEIDAVEFERRAAGGDRAGAAALYRGDYLEDFYDDWVLPERERYRELQSANLAALIDDRRRAMDFEAAIAHAQALLRLDPLREDAIRQVMSLRFAAGDRSGSLAKFEAFRIRLRDELEAEPMPETIALREAIRRDDLSATAAPGIAREPAGARGFPFVGRGPALQTLRDAWEAAAHGSGAIALVSGEAGSGKSRVIDELIALAGAQGGRVILGTTSAVEAEPYQALAEALRGASPLLRVDRLAPATIGALSSLLPEFADASGTSPLPALDPERERLRLFEAMLRAVLQLAEKRPLLVVLEDVHWARAATIDMLAFIARRVADASILLVVSFREEELDAKLREFVRRLDAARTRHVALGPLEREDFRTLVERVLPALDPGIADSLYAASGGNALFATEFLRDRMTGNEQGGVPTGIAATVHARIESLSPGARAFVEAAAVCGQGFEADLVRRTCGWSFAESFDALDELLDRALARLSPLRRGDYAFSHQLVHAVAYESIETSRRKELHRRAARTLAAAYPAVAATQASIARHYDRAGLSTEALAAYRRAAAHAREVSAHDDVALLVTRALELASDARERFELHRLREEAAAFSGDVNLRRADCAALEAIAADLGDDELLAIAHARTFACRFLAGERDAASSTAGALQRVGMRLNSARWIVEGAIAQARLERERSRYVLAERFLAKVEPIVRSVSDDALVVNYWSQRALNSAWTDASVAAACCERARERAGTHRALRAAVVLARAQLAEVCGDVPVLRDSSRELLELSRDIGDIEGQAAAHRNLASAAWYEWDGALDREHTSAAFELYQTIGKPNAIAAIIYHRANGALRVGDFVSAEADFVRARATWNELGMPANRCSAMLGLACTALFRGDPAAAREIALEIVAAARDHGLERSEIDALDLLGRAEFDLGRCDRALEHLERALTWRREHDPRQTLESLIDLIAVYLALDSGQRALAAAVEVRDAIGRDRDCVSFPAHGLAMAAKAFEAASDVDAASVLRERARRTLDEMAARIGDDGARAGFLALPFHRGLAGPVDGAGTREP